MNKKTKTNRSQDAVEIRILKRFTDRLKDFEKGLIEPFLQMSMQDDGIIFGYGIEYGYNCSHITMKELVRAAIITSIKLWGIVIIKDSSDREELSIMAIKYMPPSEYLASLKEIPMMQTNIKLYVLED